MEISRRVADQLRQMKRQIDSLEAQVRALTFNTSATDSHYLVEAPVDGIPAFVDPIPGMANCNIVRRFSSDTDEDKELAVSTSKERVYNLGPEITEGGIAVAHRDAFGDLFILAAAQSNGMRLVITDGTMTAAVASTGTMGTGDVINVTRVGAVLWETAEDPYEVYNPWQFSIATGKLIGISQWDGIWIVSNAECDPDDFVLSAEEPL